MDRTQVIMELIAPVVGAPHEMCSLLSKACPTTCNLLHYNSPGLSHHHLLLPKWMLCFCTCPSSSLTPSVHSPCSSQTDLIKHNFDLVTPLLKTPQWLLTFQPTWYLFFFLKIYLFEREREQGKGQRERNPQANSLPEHEA